MSIIIISLAFFLIGCAGQKVEKISIDEVKDYADAAAERIFIGISKEDYNLFSEDFDEQMISALTEQKFKEIVKQLGKYESKEIIGADRVQGYTRVHYKTKFSKISREVLFTVVFSEADEMKVSGLFYK
ncbi:DUF3887 domain-containing protein [Proteiniborus sp. DW1]|uniref:DUF3887 domain-containing protein n=1 Tax=Proteiniborus sp. DW1 TaxID=1889883 RepID=UPI000945653B|nr:DUF3887 domain-containing protein [Proteiniborus sp. DW1]